MTRKYRSESAYRYELFRTIRTPGLFGFGDSDRRTVLWIMLNPSTATEWKDDPTVRRCIRFSRDWGYSVMRVVNLFAARTTIPHALERMSDPVGPLNDGMILYNANVSDLIVCAWGSHWMAVDRAAYVIDLLTVRGARKTLYALALNADGQPGHPLYLKGESEPFVFKTKRRSECSK